uniref:Uncharacterized protein n=1 Tax=Arundo donax TaxID=35708 RepID=A0A0A9BTM5_ARUDO
MTIYLSIVMFLSEIIINFLVTSYIRILQMDTMHPVSYPAIFSDSDSNSNSVG